MVVPFNVPVVTPSKMTLNQLAALRAYPSVSRWDRCPFDGEQIVDRTWGAAGTYVYERAHYRNNRSLTITAHRAAKGPWNPANGEHPSGRRIGVIFEGPEEMEPRT